VKLAAPVVLVAAVAARRVRTPRVHPAPVTVARQVAAVATMEAAHPALDLVQVVSVRPLVASIVLPVAVDTVLVAVVRAVVAARAIAIVKARQLIARRSDATTTTAIRPFVA